MKSIIFHFMLIAPILLIIFFGVYRAIRKHRRQEARLTYMKKQMQAMARLASLGKISATLAHEIKNPLNFVINFSVGAEEVLKDSKEALAAYQEHPNTEKLQFLGETLEELQTTNRYIQDHGYRVDRIIKQILGHTHQPNNEKTIRSLNEMIEEQLYLVNKTLIRPREGQQIQLLTNFDQIIPPLPLHWDELERVMSNLLGNACYAVEQRARLEGKAYVPTIEISTKTLMGQVRILIRDNGVGIPPELQSKIFTPFFTTKSALEGNSGLGLSISKELISLLFKGEIQVRSEVGSFTEFEILFPLPELVAETP